MKAPGTWENLYNAKKKYLQFCQQYGQKLTVTQNHLLAYIEYLCQKHYTPGYIKNSICNLNTLLKLDGKHFKSFESQATTRALQSVIKDKHCLTLPRPHIPLTMLLHIIKHMDHSFIHLILRFVTIISFTAGLRQSAVLLPQFHIFDIHKHLIRADIFITASGIHFTLKWAKNLQKYNQSKEVHLAPSPNPLLCPVTLYKRILLLSPTTSNHLPFLHFPATGLPITTIHIASQWKTLIQSLNIPPNYTLHSVIPTGI